MSAQWVGKGEKIFISNMVLNDEVLKKVYGTDVFLLIMIASCHANSSVSNFHYYKYTLSDCSILPSVYNSLCSDENFIFERRFVDCLIQKLLWDQFRNKNSRPWNIREKCVSKISIVHKLIQIIFALFCIFVFCVSSS